MDLNEIVKGMPDAAEKINENFEDIGEELDGDKVEYGSNEHGEYWKYADGRLVCVGNIGYDREDVEVLGEYPHDFVDAPAGSISSRARSYASLQDLASLGYYFGKDEIRLMKHTQLGFRENTGVINIKWSAIGRWK